VGIEFSSEIRFSELMRVRKQGARQKSLLLWMRRCYEVFSPPAPNEALEMVITYFDHSLLHIT